MIAPSPAAGFAQPNHLVILGHPDPESFVGTVARTYRDAVSGFGQEVTIRDLYALDFDPRLGAEERPDHPHFAVSPEIQEDLELVRRADVITLVYPIWFGMPPAIIKGYVDRVLGAGFTHAEIKQGAPHPVLAGKRLMLLTASASTRPWLEEKGQWHSLRQAFEFYLETIFSMKDAGHTHFDAVVPGLKPQFVEEYLEVVRERARAISAEILAEKRAAQSLAVRRGVSA